MNFYELLIIVFVVSIVTPLIDAHLQASREFLSMLNGFPFLKRDVCTNAIHGTVSEICAPGKTLCCVPSTNTGAASTFPQCQNVTGMGACCVSETSCYIDTISDCSATGAVQCTKLTKGTTEACCPSGTTCPGNFNQSSSEVRCNLVLSSTTSSSPAQTLTSIRTPSSILISSSNSYAASSSINANNFISMKTSISVATTGTPNASSSSNSLSGGADAGIGVGSAVAILAFCAVGFWLYKRGKNRSQASPYASQESGNIGSYNDYNTSVGMMSPSTGTGIYHASNKASPYVKYELPSEPIQLAEMSGN